MSENKEVEPVKEKEVESVKEKEVESVKELDLASQRLEFLISEIEKVTQNEKITAVNILTICLSGMQIVEKMPSLKGSEKKELVIKGIEAVLAKSNSDSALSALLPSFIDNMIGVEKGKITISIDPEETVTCCFAFCNNVK